MDPLITNGIDAALLRVLDKRGHDRDPAKRPRPSAASKRPLGERRDEERPDDESQNHESQNAESQDAESQNAESPNDDEQLDQETEPDPDAPRHKLDDMA